MTKQSAKNTIVLVNGYNLSTLATSFEATQEVQPIPVTGFGEGFINNVPGLITAKMSATMFWDSAAGSVHTALGALPTGHATVIPEGYTLGNPSFSMPFMQSNYAPKGQVDGAIEVGTIGFENYGTTNGVEHGWILQHGTTVDDFVGTGFIDPSGAAVTKACSATLHIWAACAVDVYEIKVQHSSSLGSGYADLITFTSDGTTLTSERQTVASGTINKYRRVIATCALGSTGNTLGFSVHFFHN